MPSTATRRVHVTDKRAIVWEGEPGEVRTLTYADLYAEVQRFANVLKRAGVMKGDRVAHLHGRVSGAGDCAAGMCARIGAVHNVVFGGFAASALG